MILSLQNLCCGYRDKIVVKEFNAEIASGDVFCLLGPNGIGKTTLFKTILGLLPLKGGALTIDGKDLNRLSQPEQAKLLGYVPQAQSQPFAFTVFDVVLMGRTAHLGLFGKPGPVDYETATDILGRLGISYLKDRIYTELSGGERQMVLIARALAQEPAFLMMDEPTSNLDFGNQVRVIKNIMKLARSGLGIIMTSHFPDHVFQCGTKVALMQKGNKYIQGNVEQVLTENNLLETYGVPVAILEVSREEHSFHCCQPIFAGLGDGSGPGREQ